MCLYICMCRCTCLCCACTCPLQMSIASAPSRWSCRSPRPTCRRRSRCWSCTTASWTPPRWEDAHDTPRFIMSKCSKPTNNPLPSTFTFYLADWELIHPLPTTVFLICLMSSYFLFLILFPEDLSHIIYVKEQYLTLTSSVYLNEYCSPNSK